MHKLLVLYPAPVDPAAFDAYYRETHLPLAQALPGIRDIQFATGLTEGPYYAVFEAQFESTEAFGAAMSSEAGAAVGADVPNYATGGAIVLDFPVETV